MKLNTSDMDILNIVMIWECLSHSVKILAKSEIKLWVNFYCEEISKVDQMTNVPQIFKMRRKNGSAWKMVLS